MEAQRPSEHVGVSRRSGVLAADGCLSAVIDGVGWKATEALLATVQGGLLAVVGYDRSGRGVALALAIDGPGEQRIGASAANAIVTIGGISWAAEAADGAGYLRLDRVTERSASGAFCFRARQLTNPVGHRVVTVSEGRFDVVF
jgi:hypothetical protein